VRGVVLALGAALACALAAALAPAPSAASHGPGVAVIVHMRASSAIPGPSRPGQIAALLRRRASRDQAALLDAIKQLCRQRGVWLSLDPKPVHHLDLTGLSLITPNRKEAFELAGLGDDTRCPNPLQDSNLMEVADKLLNGIRPALVLITLGDLGMLLCQHGEKPFHIPTVAQEVFDVSGAGDTVIAEGDDTLQP